MFFLKRSHPHRSSACFDVYLQFGVCMFLVLSVKTRELRLTYRKVEISFTLLVVHGTKQLHLYA